MGKGSYIASVWTVFHSLTFGSFFVHQWDVSVRNFLSALYGFNLLPLFYSLTLLFIKSAILLEWLSVFVPFGTRNLFFWACWALIVVNGIFYIAATFVIGFTCRPIEKYWMPMVHGHCFDRRAFDFASSIINFILDLTMIAIPQRIIWALNMRVKRKVGLSVLFSIGILTCASALGRVITGHILLDSADRTYYLAVPALLAIAEMTGGYLVFCVPVVPKVLNQSIPFEKFLYSFKSWVRIQPQNASSERNVTTWAPNKTSNSDSREENQWNNSQPNAQGILLTTQLTTGDDVTSRASQGWPIQRNNMEHYHGDR
ncbi:putative ribosomal protein L36e [Rosellinia necatrix]|uniref:Putative ribosomal protein L36e n=1 Tax=Rosellinia necatrix TaxID=77044 RepID=A0A1S8A8C5_ROSNE|nr:putative ribosomal protein L36e [Rosellinia necatrix]